MNTLNKKSPSIRILLTNADGEEVAIPLNDTLKIHSGFAEKSMPQEYYDKLKDHTDRLSEDKDISTLNSDQHWGNFTVTLGIREIFRRATEAQKSGEMLVDLTADSGFDALVKKAETTKAQAPKRKR